MVGVVQKFLMGEPAQLHAFGWDAAAKEAAMKTSSRISVVMVVMMVAAALLATEAAAQQQPSPAIVPGTTAPGTVSSADTKHDDADSAVVCPLSVGTAFNARLIETLDARRSKSGDKFTAETTETVRYGRSIIFPRGTLIEGHVVRRSISTHGPDRAALFLQFDKAVLKNGQQAVMNAGIQAMAVGANPPAVTESASAGSEDPDADASVRDAAVVRALPADASLDTDVSAKNVMAVSHEPAEAHVSMLHPPALELPQTQGAFTKHGLLTSDSKGALGAPDIRVYTPLSEGSDGTVLMSTRNNVHLERGTRLLIVIQPPRLAASVN
jgi:hypothetical protein